MQPSLEQIFHLLIHEQCAVALDAAAGLDLAVASVPPDVARAFACLQVLLGAAGNVSKCLWSAGKGPHAVNREPLRKALGVSDASLLACRDMRNHFEHFDERVAHWWATAAPGMFIDSNVGSPRAFGPNARVMRNYDPATGVASYQGDTLSVTDLRRELGHLHAMTADWHALRKS